MNKLAKLVTLILVSGFLVALGNAAEKEIKKPGIKEEEKKFPFDNGPDTIDVSKYPEEMQKYYQTFRVRCGKCHTIARPINSDYALPDEWKRYVKRMMRKPGSGIDSPTGKKIYEFLAYDSSVRKKDILQKKLQATTTEQHKNEEGKK